MSILIKGMEMPKSCNECRFAVDGWCYAYPKQANGDALNRRVRTNWCPLIEIQPHGRLIDADALCGRLEKAGKIKPHLESGLNVAISFALTAPTIIPADDPKEE